MLELVIRAVSPLLNTLHRSVLHSVVIVSGMLRLCTCGRIILVLFFFIS